LRFAFLGEAQRLFRLGSRRKQVCTMLGKIRELHTLRSCVRCDWRPRAIGIFGFLLLIAPFSSWVYAQIPSGSQIPSGLVGVLQGEGSTEGSNGVDCSDPLMASSAECFGLTQTQSSPFGVGGMSPALGGEYGLPEENPTGTYSDLEKLNPNASSAASSTQKPEAGPPPEPLTEFQKFIAETTGQILPIFGADLFRNVPTTFTPLSNAPVPSDYVIGPGDELRVRIWGNVNVQDNLRVDRSGDVYLPQVGPVHVAGLPYAALESHLRDAVGRVFRNFNLTADVGQIRAIQVYVTGQARRPGVYTVSALSTLIDALFSSGGPSVEGSLRRIVVRRNGATVTTFDLYNFLIDGDKSKDVKLLDGDVIYIPPAGPQVAVTGSVRKPGIYELASGESLGGVIADAGGVSAVAAEARISIERVGGHRDREAMEVAYDAAGLASPLDDGDLVRVFSIVPAYAQTVTLRGNTANPGRFAWHAGMRVSDLIPDRESLLTRNYWWKRAQLGLPSPEFEPQADLSYLRQPSENYPANLQLETRGLNQREALAVQQQRMQAQRPTSQQGGTTQTGQAIAAQTSQTPNQPYSSFVNSEAPLPAQQQASASSLAGEQAASYSSRFPYPTQKTEIQLSAPEIDWSYAVIERLDTKTLKTELIPFDLGKLVLDHDASQDLELEPGDVVTIFSQADVQVPIAQQTKLVKLEGEFVHSGVYSVLPGETLRTLVERAGGLTPNAYLYGSEFTRRSTRALQQERIDEYVQSMNLSIERGTLALVAAPAASAKDISSGAAAAGMENQLLASLRQIRATGRIVLEFKPGSAGADSLPNISLEDGDAFTVPPVPSTVNVVGAVYDQNSFLYARGLRVNAYLRLAGGPNKDADRRHAFIIRADGEVISYAMTRGPWGYGFDTLPMNPGDTIVIPDKTIKPTFLSAFFDWAQFFSQFALGAAALTVILP
jgi:protein involved in polysaccharide export with SLBB domain